MGLIRFFCATIEWIIKTFYQLTKFIYRVINPICISYMQTFLILQTIALIVKYKHFKIDDCFAYGFLIDGNKIPELELNDRIRTTCSLFGIDKYAYNLFDIVENDKSPLTILEEKKKWSQFLYFSSKDRDSFVETEHNLADKYLGYSVIGYIVQALMFAATIKIKDPKLKVFFQTLQEAVLIVLVFWNKLIFFGQYGDFSSLDSKTVVEPPKSAYKLMSGVDMLQMKYFQKAIESGINKNELITGYEYVLRLELVNYFNFFNTILLLGFIIVLSGYVFLKLYQVFTLAIDDALKQSRHVNFKSVV